MVGLTYFLLSSWISCNTWENFNPWPYGLLSHSKHLMWLRNRGIGYSFTLKWFLFLSYAMQSISLWPNHYMRNNNHKMDYYTWMMEILFACLFQVASPWATPFDKRVWSLHYCKLLLCSHELHNYIILLKLSSLVILVLAWPLILIFLTATSCSNNFLFACICFL